MKSVFRSKRIPSPGSNYSPGFNVNNLLFMSGLLATDYRTGVPAQAKPDPVSSLPDSSVRLQAEYVLNNLRLLLEDAESSLDDILRADIYMLDVGDYPVFSEVWQKYFPKNAPTQNVVGVKKEGTYWGQGLLGSIGDLFEVDVIAAAPKENFRKRVVPTPNLPKRADNGSLLVAAGDYVFTSGLRATDYETGVPSEARTASNFPWFGSDVKLQTKYVLEQLRNILNCAGTSLGNVVKANVFLLDFRDYYEFNEVWDEYFPKNKPARTVTNASGLLGPGGTRLQVEAIAVIPSGRTSAKVVQTRKIAKPSRGYTFAVEAGGTLFTSGLTASDYKTGIPAVARTNPNFPWFGSDIKLQVEYTLEKLKTLLEDAGCSLKDVAKANMYLTDLRDYHAFTEVLPKYFSGVDPPARTVFEVERILGATGTKFEIEAIAAVD